jgi:glycosyltransferase involved in cell wall biosynthesis
MNTSIPVTVIVPVMNEERSLGACLERLTRFQEVLVVDSGSSDATADIAMRFGARVLQFKWNGSYPKKRNWVLLNHSLASDWVLFLDADEVVDDSFCNAVACALRTGKHSGYWLRYSNFFAGKRLKHGVPQRKLALFKKDAGLFERIEEFGWSKLDMEVHEHPQIVGSVDEISVPIEHRDFRGLARFLERHLDYAKWEARRLLLLKAQGAVDSDALTKRQRFKYSRMERWWYPWAYFAYTYVVRLGFLDGRAGFLYAYYKAWYFMTIRLLVREFGEEASAPGRVA